MSMALHRNENENLQATFFRNKNLNMRVAARKEASGKMDKLKTY